MDFLSIAYLLGLGMASVGLGKIFGPIFLAILQHFMTKTKTTLDDRIFKEISSPVQSFFFLFIFIIGTHYLGEFSGIVKIVDSYTTSALVVLATYLLVNATKAIFEWYEAEGALESRIKLDLSFLPLVRKITQIFLAIIGASLALSQIGYDVTGVLAVTSIVGVIAGLAAQETLGNIFAGIALQLDRPYYYGDYLRLQSGEIARLKKIGIRTTRLTDMVGNTILLANSEISRQKVTRLTKGAKIASLSIPFEAPCAIPPSLMQDEIRSKIRLGDFGIDDIGSVKVLLVRIRAPGWYEAIILVHTKEPEKLSDFTDFANALILERITALENSVSEEFQLPGGLSEAAKRGKARAVKRRKSRV
ncbi:MAG TPA: mechanosensitive ion channel family protein [Candidatus Micrarchaeota archaeon]|nr:mechanosensitive ion channel family protein [Candidatus Micrarchaeota archaeon]